MPRATPQRSGRRPKPGSRFAGQVLADNVRSYRQLRRLTQADLARIMRALGHDWADDVVGFLERGRRNATVDELVGLTVALSVGQVGRLLDPSGVGPNDPTASDLDYGGVEVLDRDAAHRWLSSATNFGLFWPPLEEKGERA